jgi:hypothetical protein
MMRGVVTSTPSRSLRQPARTMRPTLKRVCEAQAGSRTLTPEATMLSFDSKRVLEISRSQMLTEGATQFLAPATN